MSAEPADPAAQVATYSSLKACRRNPCQTWVRVEVGDPLRPYCSADCRRIDEVTSWPVDSRLPVAAMGGPAAVVQAAGLGWLDVRAAS